MPQNNQAPSPKSAEETAAYPPPKRWVVVAMLCAAVVLVGVFALLLRHSLRAAVPLNPAEYEQSAPEGFLYDLTSTLQNGTVAFEGWACVQGERFESVDTWVVLHHVPSGAYLRVPTVMQLSEEAPPQLDADEIDYARGGFTAFVLLQQLTAPLDEYEVCIAYRSNGHNALVHTGQSLPQGV